ncbi:MAG: TRAP transporter small permease subunit, partial [Hyphomicrobiaceae bacterium]
WVRDRLTFSGSDEISGYLFAVGTSWSLSHTLVTRGHVRIDAVYGNLSPAVRAWLDLVALVCLAVFVGALVERAWDVSVTNLIEYNRSNTNLRIPLAWSQLPWMAGIVLFFTTMVVAILRTIGLLLRGDYATVNAIAGASSQDEEIESELKGLGIERPHVEKA